VWRIGFFLCHTDVVTSSHNPHPPPPPPTQQCSSCRSFNIFPPLMGSLMTPLMQFILAHPPFFPHLSGFSRAHRVRPCFYCLELCDRNASEISRFPLPPIFLLPRLPSRHWGNLILPPLIDSSCSDFFFWRFSYLQAEPDRPLPDCLIVEIFAS